MPKETQTSTATAAGTPTSAASASGSTGVATAPSSNTSASISDLKTPNQSASGSTNPEEKATLFLNETYRNLAVKQCQDYREHQNKDTLITIITVLNNISPGKRTFHDYFLLGACHSELYSIFEIDPVNNLEKARHFFTTAIDLVDDFWNLTDFEKNVFVACLNFFCKFFLCQPRHLPQGC